MSFAQIQSELEKLGGRVGNQPMLRIVDGERELEFANGRWIPKYRYNPPRAFKHTTMKFRLRNIHTNEVRECSREEAKAVWDKCTALDPDNDLLPETSRTVEIEVLAAPVYGIEQFFPPDKIKDTPEAWEANRFGMWFDETLGREVRVDKLGSFPENGRYEEIFRIPKVELGEGQKVLQTVRRALKRREEWHRTKSDELMVKDVFQEAALREKQSEDEVIDRIASELAPHAFTGVYLSSGNPEKMNKRTKHGKAR